MKPVTPAALCLFALTLGACDSLATVKATLYSTGARIGNRYCETRDPLLRDDLMGRINRGLADQGATFTLLGMACDDESSPEPQG